jgi:signal transduction histidine kinase/ligand-binding sensor domain-containing protein
MLYRLRVHCQTLRATLGDSLALGALFCALAFVVVAVVWVSPVFVQSPNASAQSSDFGKPRFQASNFQMRSASETPQQSLPATALFERLTIDDALPQNSVFAIAQDARGFLWFGTQDGLCRFDGYSVKLFRHNRRRAERSLSSNYITALLVDSRGDLWVGTAGGGLNKYNRFDHSFTVYAHDPNNPNSLADNHVQALLEDREGNLWIGSERGGLQCFNPQSGRFRSYRHDPGNSKSLPSNRVHALCQDSNGVIWAGTMGGGACRFEPRDSSFTPLPPAEASLGSALNVAALCADNNGLLWVGSRGAGALCFDARRFQWRKDISFAARRPTFRSSPLLPALYGENDVFALCKDRAGNLWIGLDGGGVNVLNAERQTTVKYFHDPTNASSLGDNFARSLLCDRAGNIWIGSITGGVSVFSPLSQRFPLYRNEPLNAHSLVSNVVRSFCEDSLHRIWVGTVDGGLALFDRRAGRFERHEYRPASARNNPALGGSEDVWALAATPDGVLWVGTQNGLYAYRPETGARAMYRHNPADSRSLSANAVRALHLDRDGVLWVGSLLGGLCRYNARTDDFTTYRFPLSAPSSSSAAGTAFSDDIRAILHASDGLLWLGTANIGLLAFDKQSETVKKIYQHIELPAMHDSIVYAGEISNNSIRYLHEDKRGNIWVGTLEGLNRLPLSGGEATMYTQAEGGGSGIGAGGMLNDVVYGIMEDADERLWITTNKGMARFDPARGFFQFYTKEDGLQSNEFNGNAVLRASDGWLYAGGIGGFNAFFPDSVRDALRRAPTLILDCKVFGKSVATDTALTERTSLTLAHTNNNFTFEFAALNFVGAKKNRYRYKLEGFDKDWVEAGARREAIYTNVEPGEYRFHVQTSLAGGGWSDDEATLALVVTPPWWGTWYFRAVALLALFAFGYAVAQTRYYSLRKTAKLLEERVHRRTQALTEINAQLAEANEEVQRQMLQQYEQARELQEAYQKLDAAKDALIMRNRELTELNKEKNDLLGIVSHDLRNPLVSATLAVKILHKRFSELSDEQKFSYLEHIQSANEQMIDFLNKLLSVSALETGKIAVELQACDAVALCRSVVEAYRLRAEAKGLSFVLEMDHGDGEAFALADRTLLPQAIDNLVSNAVKYSLRDKKIYVRVRRYAKRIVEDGLPSPTGAFDATIRIEIEDEGPGFSEEDRAQLFNKFTRLSARPTGGEHSTGLGLSIVKKMVDAMGGRVWCEDSGRLPGGALFVMEFVAVSPSSRAGSGGSGEVRTVKIGQKSLSSASPDSQAPGVEARER